VEEDEEKPAHVTISTTFSGEHAKLILDLEEEYQCTKPTALRLLLNQYIQGKMISLSSSTKERIDLIINNPAISKQFGFESVDGFIDFAINHTLQSIQNTVSDLRDPAVQAILDKEEQDVALFLLKSRDKHPEGVNLSQIAKTVGLSENITKLIIRRFSNRNWIIETKQELYLPVINRKLPQSFDSE